MIAGLEKLEGLKADQLFDVYFFTVSGLTKGGLGVLELTNRRASMGRCLQASGHRWSEELLLGSCFGWLARNAPVSTQQRDAAGRAARKRARCCVHDPFAQLKSGPVPPGRRNR